MVAGPGQGVVRARKTRFLPLDKGRPSPKQREKRAPGLSRINRNRTPMADKTTLETAIARAPDRLEGEGVHSGHAGEPRMAPRAIQALGRRTGPAPPGGGDARRHRPLSAPPGPAPQGGRAAPVLPDTAHAPRAAAHLREVGPPGKARGFQSTMLTSLCPAGGPPQIPKAWLTAAEADIILAAPRIGEATGLRDRALLETLYSTGLRRTEAVRLTEADLDFASGTVLVRQGKGRKDRVVPIGDRALQWVGKIPRRRPPQTGQTRP